MAGNPTERLQWKEPLHSLEIELQQDFGLTPIRAKAHFSPHLPRFHGTPRDLRGFPPMDASDRRDSRIFFPYPRA